MKKMRSVKGFTLVEVIVVMVILAILAALMVPSLTKYIDKANDQSIKVEARYCVTALQTEASELYAGNRKLKDDKLSTELLKPEVMEDVMAMAEAPGEIKTVHVTGTKVDKFTYISGDKQVEAELVEGVWNFDKISDAPAAG